VIGSQLYKIAGDRKTIVVVPAKRRIRKLDKFLTRRRTGFSRILLQNPQDNMIEHVMFID